ncbi:MAG: ATPase, T2SS/T4P/T4SS family [Candidatus Micrarchaeota archaeon]
MDLNEALSRAKAEAASSKSKADSIREAVAEPAGAAPEQPVVQQSPAAEKILIESYGSVRISKLPGDPLYLYEIPAPHYRGEEKALINTLLEIASGVVGEELGSTAKEKRHKYLEKILQIIEATPELHIPIHAKEFYAEAVVKEMAGFGIIDELIQDDQLEEIMIIGPQKPVFVFHRKYEMMKTNIVFYDDKDIRNIIDKMGRTIGRRIDNQAPLLDARLPDGSRVNATIQPASIDGSTLTLRKFRKDPLTIVDLINANTLDLDVAALLWLVGDGLGARPANILVAGGTACGKTTTLNVLASFIPSDERIVSIEDTAELSMPLEHWIRMEVRPASVEGTGEISMDTLVKNSLRMRPDRVIVGEIRGAEGFTMFTAMNTGHNGTAQANEPLYLASGGMPQFEQFFEQSRSLGRIVQEEGFEYIDLSNAATKPQVIALDTATLRSVHKPVSRIWRRKSAPQESVLEARTDSGRNIRLSWDHPVFRLSQRGFLEQVHFKQIRPGDRIAVPKRVSTAPFPLTSPIEEKIGKSTARIGEISVELAYSIGVLLADGHLRRGFAGVYTDSGDVAEAFGKGFAAACPEAKFRFKYVPRRSSFVGSIHSTSLSEALRRLGVPYGNKTFVFRVPDCILESPDAQAAAFVRGAFDSGGCACVLRGGSLRLSSVNARFVSQVKGMLLRFGIASRVYGMHDSQGRPSLQLTIYGADNLLKFREKIGFTHPKKGQRLEAILERAGVANPNSDVYPVGTVLAGIRGALGMTQLALSIEAGFGSTRSVVEAYETGSRAPSAGHLGAACNALRARFNSRRDTLVLGYALADSLEDPASAVVPAAASRLLAFLKESGISICDFEERAGIGSKMLYAYARGRARPSKTQVHGIRLAAYALLSAANAGLENARKELLHLTALSGGDVAFERVVSFGSAKPSEFQYDLTVEDAHTYLSGTNGGIFVHNCLGTVHSNSAKETVVRLGSPPISVSHVMLNALNFIIMQHRIHDRRKGVIRRVTELAECIDGGESGPSLQIIYTWDAAKDKLVPTGTPIAFLQTIALFSGLAVKDMDAELVERRRILEDLVKRGVRDQAGVCMVTQSYILRKRGKL